jgi:hypothetical protein
MKREKWQQKESFGPKSLIKREERLRKEYFVPENRKLNTGIKTVTDRGVAVPCSADL